MSTENIPALRSLRLQLIAFGAAKGLLFWYAIEKLFETKIGLSPQQIVLVGVVAQGSKVIFELPTSVFADRWSRRNILLIAEAAMFVCCVVLGLSNSLAVYVIGVLFWSLSDALISGVYEAFAYDSIAAVGYKRHFQHIYTRMKSAELLTMATAGVAAGFLSLHFNLRLSFFLSIISTVICSFLLLRLAEPTISRTSEGALSWLGHIKGALGTLSSTKLRWPATIYVAFFGFLCVWYEYYQLLGIDIKVSPLLFGSLISILTLGMMLGSEIAHRRPGTKKMVAVVWIIIVLTHVIGLRFHTAWAAFISLFITFVVLMLLEVYLEIYLQEAISSDRRATIFSLLSTLGYAWFFVLATVFGFVLRPMGIRGALTIASLPLLALGILDILKGLPWALGKSADEPLPEELIER